MFTQFTQCQWVHIRKALKKRLQYLKQGARKGTVDLYTIIEVEAALDVVSRHIKNTESDRPDDA